VVCRCGCCRLDDRCSDVSRRCGLVRHVRYHLRASGAIAFLLGLEALSSLTPPSQDKKDDILVGVKSTALRFPTTSRTFIFSLSATFVSLLTVTGQLAGLGPLYYLISCAGAGAHLAWQCAAVDFDSRPDCWSKFISNGWLGGLVWLGIAADYVQQVVVQGL